MSIIDSVDEIWSKVAQSGEEDTGSKVCDADNVWHFGGADGESGKKTRDFVLKGLALADSDCDEDDWGSV